MNEPPPGVRGLRLPRGRSLSWGAGRTGWVCGAAGALLCVLGWYGISGERYAERQLPYLASASIPGAALIVAGAVLIARPDPEQAREQERERSGRDEELRRQLALLYDLLVEEAGRTPQGGGLATAAGSGVPTRLSYLPNGRTYHRAGCLLVEGRGDALPVTPAGARDRGLRPCPLCAPDQPGGPTPSAPGPE
ncbi:hypothetical protein [Streptacidiphilus rugosus]|uniref:hypothetical protein n=1 Tax=Streptacidiphilus rugosus TaxID=405783 RepID=UPI00068C9C36|nr:hypothetical protein [Streptacidiphilus rugosus]